MNTSTSASQSDDDTEADVSSQNASPLTARTHYSRQRRTSVPNVNRTGLKIDTTSPALKRRSYHAAGVDGSRTRTSSNASVNGLPGSQSMNAIAASSKSRTLSRDLSRDRMQRQYSSSRKHHHQAHHDSPSSKRKRPRPMSEALLPTSLLSNDALPSSNFADEPTLKELLAGINMDLALDIVKGAQAQIRAESQTNSQHSRSTSNAHIDSRYSPSRPRTPSSMDTPSLTSDPSTSRPLLEQDIGTPKTFARNGMQMSPVEMTNEHGSPFQDKGKEKESSPFNSLTRKRKKSILSPSPSLTLSGALNIKLGKIRTRIDNANKEDDNTSGAHTPPLIRASTPDVNRFWIVNPTLEREFEESIHKVYMQLTPATVKRANETRKRFDQRYSTLFKQIGTGQTPTSLIKVARWRRDNLSILQSVIQSDRRFNGMRNNQLSRTGTDAASSLRRSIDSGTKPSSYSNILDAFPTTERKAVEMAQKLIQMGPGARRLLTDWEVWPEDLTAYIDMEADLINPLPYTAPEEALNGPYEFGMGTNRPPSLRSMSSFQMDGPPLSRHNSMRSGLLSKSNLRKQTSVWSNYDLAETSDLTHSPTVASSNGGNTSLKSSLRHGIPSRTWQQFDFGPLDAEPSRLSRRGSVNSVELASPDVSDNELSKPRSFTSLDGRLQSPSRLSQLNPRRKHMSDAGRYLDFASHDLDSNFTAHLFSPPGRRQARQSGNGSDKGSISSKTFKRFKASLGLTGKADAIYLSHSVNTRSSQANDKEARLTAHLLDDGESVFPERQGNRRQLERGRDHQCDKSDEILADARRLLSKISNVERTAPNKIKAYSLSLTTQADQTLLQSRRVLDLRNHRPLFDLQLEKELENTSAAAIDHLLALEDEEAVSDEENGSEHDSKEDSSDTEEEAPEKHPHGNGSHSLPANALSRRMTLDPGILHQSHFIQRRHTMAHDGELPFRSMEDPVPVLLGNFETLETSQKKLQEQVTTVQNMQRLLNEELQNMVTDIGDFQHHIDTDIVGNLRKLQRGVLELKPAEKQSWTSYLIVYIINPSFKILVPFFFAVANFVTLVLNGMAHLSGWSLLNSVAFPRRVKIPIWICWIGILYALWHSFLPNLFYWLQSIGHQTYQLGRSLLSL